MLYFVAFTPFSLLWQIADASQLATEDSMLQVRFLGQFDIRIDGKRFRLQNTRTECVVVRRLEREGYEPLEIGAVIPPNGTMSLPARDARGAKVTLEVIRCIDVIAPRKYATVRHAGELVERPGLIDDLGLAHLPLIPALPKILHGISPSDDDATEDSSSAPK